MNNGSTNGASKVEIVFGELNYDEAEKEIKMPPEHSNKKYIEDSKENFIEIVAHKNTREILQKLEESKNEKEI